MPIHIQFSKAPRIPRKHACVGRVTSHQNHLVCGSHYLSSISSMLASLVICFMFTSQQEAETLNQRQSWATLSMVQAHGHIYTSRASCPKGFIVTPKCCQLGITSSYM